MFNNRQPMRVRDWWMFYLLMIIPLVNIVVYLALLFSGSVNQSLRSYLWASLIPAIIVIVLFFSLGVGAFLMGQ